jgi:hypothetical protein
MWCDSVVYLFVMWFVIRPLGIGWGRRAEREWPSKREGV